MQLFKKTNFDFIGKRYYAYGLSALLLLSGVASLVAKGGPKLGIDFTGGTLVQLKLKENIPMKDLRAALTAAGHSQADLQDFVANKSVIIRVQGSRGAEAG